jgi:hypothetical protein
MERTYMFSASVAVLEVDDVELAGFVRRLEGRVQQYLSPRPDNMEQADHLSHVADRTRWLYFSELQRQNPGLGVSISRHDNALIDACALSHDIGKWIPRQELQMLMPVAQDETDPVFKELRFTPYQAELFLLATKRRFGMEKDGYSPEYDAAHHLVSAYILIKDDLLGFHLLKADDQKRLIDMIVGHQFGSYFKESLLLLSLYDAEVTTGMLVDAARPDRVMGDTLACAFHDADISDLLFVGSLERRPNREDIFHTGGLVKILMINYNYVLLEVRNGPRDLGDSLRSCQNTVNNACREFLTPTAIEQGYAWRKQANRFLGHLRSRDAFTRLNNTLLDTTRPPIDRLGTMRLLTQQEARQFLKQTSVRD